MADQGQEMFENGTPDQGSNGEMFTIGGRSYTAEDAKTKIENADMFIDTLKNEKGELSEKYSQLENEVAELRRQLDNSRKLEDVISGSGQPKNPQPEPREQTTQQVSEEAINQAVERILNQRTSTQERASNMRKAVEQAASVYGESWQTKLLEMGSEVGMNKQAIQTMAETSPQAFAKLFGLQKSAARSEAAPTSTVSGGNPLNAEQAPKPVMAGGATTKDLVEQWRYSGKRVGKELGFDYTPSVHEVKQKRS